MASRIPASPVTRNSNSTRRSTASDARARSVQEPERVLRRYLLWHEAEGHSRKTERNYRVVPGLFLAFLHGKHQIDDLNALEVEHVRAWLVHLRNAPTDHGEMRSSKTIENYARHLLAFLHWCVAEGVLDHDPTERVRVPKAEKKHIRVFTDEEVRVLHETWIPPSVSLRPAVRRIAKAHGLRYRGGELAFELLSPIATHKDQGLRRLIEGHHLASVTYLGDDVSDTDAFRTLKMLREQGKCYGLAIGVVHPDSPDVLIREADILLDGPTQVKSFFRWLAEP
jgi:integrase